MENKGKTGEMAANFKVPDTNGVYLPVQSELSHGGTDQALHHQTISIYICDLIYSFLWV